jgi:hypothetical protein
LDSFFHFLRWLLDWLFEYRVLNNRDFRLFLKLFFNYRLYYRFRLNNWLRLLNWRFWLNNRVWQNDWFRLYNFFWLYNWFWFCWFYYFYRLRLFLYNWRGWNFVSFH